MADIDPSHVPDYGAVLTFGRSKFADNQASKFWIKDDRVVACACGDSHTAIITESGRVFVFGANESGQLGLAHTNSVCRPTCVKALKTEPCVLVACGKSHTIIAAENGRVFVFGDNQDGQLGMGHRRVVTQTAPPGVQVAPVPHLADWCADLRQLTAGLAHTAALTVDGRVFVWGSNEHGQCGMGDETVVLTPTILPCDNRIVQISCGYRHTALVTDEGTVLMTGDNEDGQLGTGDNETRYRMVTHHQLSNVKQVACGGLHTLVLDHNGKVYVFGNGPDGQLGLGANTLSTVVPVAIHLVNRATMIAAGHSHSAILTDNNRLMTFGDSRYGKLCFDEVPDGGVFEPQTVEDLEDIHVDQMILGGNQTMLMVSPQVASVPYKTAALRNTSNIHQGHFEVDSERKSNMSSHEQRASAENISENNQMKKRVLPSLKRASVRETADNDQANSGVQLGAHSERNIPQQPTNAERVRFVDQTNTSGDWKGASVQHKNARYHETSEDILVDSGTQLTASSDQLEGNDEQAQAGLDITEDDTVSTRQNTKERRIFNFQQALGRIRSKWSRRKSLTQAGSTKIEDAQDEPETDTDSSRNINDNNRGMDLRGKDSSSKEDGDNQEKTTRFSFRESFKLRSKYSIPQALKFSRNAPTNMSSSVAESTENEHQDTSVKLSQASPDDLPPDSTSQTKNTRISKTIKSRLCSVM